LFILLTNTASAETIIGQAHVVDGDTIYIGNSKIRLEGIDAPETDQVCFDAKGARWSCGITARDKLSELIASRSVQCKSDSTDRYGRSLSICEVGTTEINGWLVREGWALAYIAHSNRYVDNEQAALTNKRGLWSGAFIAPWEYRRRNANPEILGAMTAPVSVQRILVGAVPSNEAPSSECAIKGNVNRKGERVYHVPGQKYYNVTRMNKGTGERWFCTEDEAKAAGWRRSSQ